MSNKNLETTHAFYAAFNRRDRRAIENLLDDNFVADMSRSIGPERGIYDGVDGFGRLLDAYWQAMETFEINPTELTEGDDAVVAATHGRGIGRLSGAEVEARAAHLLHFRNGKVVRWTAYQTAADALAAADVSK